MEIFRYPWKMHRRRNDMRVELIQHTPDPEKVVASAAKLCYSPVGVSEIMEKLEEESTEKFIRILMKMGHMSPIEHVSFTFGIEGISRVCTHQLVRHRIASYSQQSQRYVKIDDFNYIVPPAISENPEALAVFEEAMENSRKAYKQISELLYDSYVEGGEEMTKRRMGEMEKKAIEDARFVFPNACETKIVVTMNARSLMNFFKHRCCNRAQWEIQGLAIQMLKLVREKSPTLFKYAGPSCLNEPCPEGKMTCGKIKEVRKKFETL